MTIRKKIWMRILLRQVKSLCENNMKGPSTGETQEGRAGLHAWRVLESVIAILCPPLISLVLESAMLSFDFLAVKRLVMVLNIGKRPVAG